MWVLPPTGTSATRRTRHSPSGTSGLSGSGRNGSGPIFGALWRCATGSRQRSDRSRADSGGRDPVAPGRARVVQDAEDETGHRRAVVVADGRGANDPEAVELGEFAAHPGVKHCDANDIGRLGGGIASDQEQCRGESSSNRPHSIPRRSRHSRCHWKPRSDVSPGRMSRIPTSAASRSCSAKESP